MLKFISQNKKPYYYDPYINKTFWKEHAIENNHEVENKDWKKVLSKGKKPYYYNSNNGKSQWKFPKLSSITNNDKKFATDLVKIYMKEKDEDEFIKLTEEKIFKDKKGKPCTTFEYYFTLPMRSESTGVEFEDIANFLKKFAKLVNTPSLRRRGLRYLCGQLFDSERYFYQIKDEFINIFRDYLNSVKSIFTLTFIFESYPSLEKQDLMINTISSGLDMTEEEWQDVFDEEYKFNAFCDLKDFITVDGDNFYYQVFDKKCKAH